MAKHGAGAPVIIKKIKKGGHGGHHGGAWKVAYADFVTAMMAFFLLLWLLNVTTDVQKRGIADYFEPTITSKSNSGAGGVLGGLTVGSPGSETVPMSQPNFNPAQTACASPTRARTATTAAAPAATRIRTTTIPARAKTTVPAQSPRKTRSSRKRNSRKKLRARGAALRAGEEGARGCGEGFARAPGARQESR